MAPERVGPLQQVHVLLIDDDDPERDSLRAALEVWGALVTATTAAQAPGAAFTADVIVCDLETAEAAGRAFLDGLWRAHGASGRRAPAIALVTPAWHAAARALDAGFQRLLTKPVRGDELRVAVFDLATPD